MNRTATSKIVAMMLVVAVAIPALAAEPRNGESAGADAVLTKAIEDALGNGTGSVTVDLPQAEGKAKAGDLVTLRYTMTTADGALVATTEESVAADKGRPRSVAFTARSRYRPEEIVAGGEGNLPGVAEAVIGMAPGEKKHLSLSADKAFGARDPQRVVTMATVKSLPRTVAIPAADYVKNFGALPVVGKELPVVPYFPARVIEVTEQQAKLQLLARDGERFTESFGAVETKVDGESVKIRLVPTIGAPFEFRGARGTITAAGEENFTVDFNHPLADRSVVLDLEVVSLTKGEKLAAISVPWLENHDQGLEKAKQEEKPAVLVLYADWCQWCKKLFGETAEDPRIKAVSDRFVWIRVNSDKEKAYKEQYGQDGYPLIVLLDRQGKVAKKLDGFRDAAGLREELNALL
ncbi:peptidylprolyl isomerase FKBP-type [Geobacter metallireducens RCH3]|uniref:peptidylprolyl isomerase n=1 Tax=Geobacter metallireducens (strain ATCC 53774 / DSM 7210 / GS-15) TaxID=269799 RepID=Q39VN4_GEOMG|nr:thioredoxin family protein [Geobacter metallireducens]ABB31690.1 redox-active protein, putative [Geobacter metallireducens GS-15]EHP89435.1 peptidylprolyl isomerase FKBP-type [Geobacter metallireducens RCH3]